MLDYYYFLLLFNDIDRCELLKLALDVENYLLIIYLPYDVYFNVNVWNDYFAFLIYIDLLLVLLLELLLLVLWV